MNEHSVMKINYEKLQVETSIKDELLVKQRKEEIIQAAIKVFAGKGYHRGTIKDISKVLGLSPGTVYNYVKKKEDILYFVHDKLTTMFSDLLVEIVKYNEDPKVQLEEVLRKTLEIVLENQDLILLVYQETAALDKESLYNVLKRQSGYIKLIEEILERGKKIGVIQNVNMQLAANIIVYLMAFIPLTRWNLKKSFNKKEIKSGLIDFILKGLYK